MLTGRPEVKRTYSRLKKESYDESEGIESDDTSTKSTVPVESANVSCDLSEELGIVKVDKMRKITDFFRIKRGNPTNANTDDNTSANPNDNISGESYDNSHGDSHDNLHDNPSPQSPIQPPLQSPPILKQTYLDLGQKNLISIQCPDCLMNYNKSFPDDVNLHKKFHSNYLKGFNFNLKIDDKNVFEVAPKDLMKWSKSKFRFYKIKKFDQNLLKKIDFFLNFVHVQLGAEPLKPEELKEFDAIVVVDHLTNKILAFGLFEKCSKIFKSLENCDNSSIELESEELSSQVLDFIGVSRIWVDEKHRSMGLAATLLDLRCSEQRERVAFSQPTPAGFIFAKSYQKSQFKGKQCLIYLK